MEDPRQLRVRELQAGASKRGDATGWFDQIYAEAQGDSARIPWSETGVNPHLSACVPENATGLTAVVIGCGLGDNAEFLAQRGYAVTAFDISPTAVEWCQRRHAGSPVRYTIADLFTAAATLGQFDFVLEANTLQALPRSLRAQAIAAVAALTKDRLLVICRGCDQPEADEVVPWPLTRTELGGFLAAGLTEVSFDDFLDQKNPPIRRFRIQYRRAYTR